MDPQLKSYLTSFALAGATALASWAATRGYITPDQQGALATGIVTIVGAGTAFAIAEYKKRQVSQTAMIQSVTKTDNGVVVVKAIDASAAGIVPVIAPVKGPEAAK